MKFRFTKEAKQQFEFWEKNDPKIKMRIISLLRAIENEPYAGIGKPEALKYELRGYWSRRITAEHRLVYQILELNEHLECLVIQCRFHYDL
ncbi:MAG: Txe/YoeB family addiction module toxin [Luteibaculum sp.]